MIRCLSLTVFFALSTSLVVADVAHFSNGFMNSTVPMRSWDEMRNEGVVRQDLDTSCGAASLATILNYFYGIRVSELDLIDVLSANGSKGAASFAELAQAAEDYGMKGIGYALGFERLKELRIPAIVYIKYQQTENHFSVLRGINENGVVWLGDPAWGNRRFTRNQFLSMWETRDDDTLIGKILLIIPHDINQAEIQDGFFRPPSNIRLPIELLTMGRH